MTHTRFHLERRDTRIGPVALVAITHGTDERTPNTFGEEALRSLGDVLGVLRTRDWRGLLVTGQPGSFAAGADITQRALDADLTDVGEVVRNHACASTTSSTGRRPPRTARWS